MGIWLKDGKLILGETGNVVECDACPCATCACCPDFIAANPTLDVSIFIPGNGTYTFVCTVGDPALSQDPCSWYGTTIVDGVTTTLQITISSALIIDNPPCAWFWHITIGGTGTNGADDVTYDCSTLPYTYTDTFFGFDSVTTISAPAPMMMNETPSKKSKKSKKGCGCGKPDMSKNKVKRPK